MGLSRADLTMIATRTGYPVRAAWTPGHGTMGTVQGVLMHHTATPQSAVGDYPSLRVVTEGRTGLAGPLCNLGLGRSGTIYLVTEGIAWHAGVGEYEGFTDGNGHFLGIEAEHSGSPSQPWPVEQADAYVRLVASILYFLNRDTTWDLRHATWALPPGRKTDIVLTPSIPTMPIFDAKVRVLLAVPDRINRHWKPVQPVEEELTVAQIADIMAGLDRVQAAVDLAIRGDHAPAGETEETQTHETHRRNLVQIGQDIDSLAERVSAIEDTLTAIAEKLGA